jgi:hypothetical protein
VNGSAERSPTVGVSTLRPRRDRPAGGSPARDLDASLGDDDFSTRWNVIKSAFTRAHLAADGAECERSPSRLRHRNRGVWQRRFWEHRCRDALDVARHVEYIHFNPVKHGRARCPTRGRTRRSIAG